ncbi:DUF6538 domain-containing protein [Pseudooceanicola marinus]|uniref:DUF6538 domain-containing protein n=1 Tax=Pseudooceanicola marinus TaxID=396013 RepID=UPI00296E9BE8|nr:DUF6538 domain-containing protein [Pseudooceanicola marinus]
MSETNSPAFTFVEDGVFHFSRHSPKELRDHYTATRITYFRRTRSPRVAKARARRAAGLWMSTGISCTVRSPTCRASLCCAR